MLEIETVCRYPVGLGEKLNKIPLKKPEKYSVVCQPVAHEVVLVNPDMVAPFDLITGSSSSGLGLFALRTHPSPNDEVEKYITEMEAIIGDRDLFQEKLARPTKSLEFWPSHHRSLILARVVFADKQGRFYRDVDIKGCGHFGGIHREGDPVMGVYVKVNVSSPGWKKRNSSDRWGLLAEQDALNDYFMSEKFLKAGIRTHRIISIVKLKEFIDHERVVPVSSVINDGFDPVLTIRAFGTKARIIDLSTDVDVNLLYQDALKVVQQELGLTRTFSFDEYCTWFARTLGKNVSLMHRQGWVHHYLLPHNITLDCRIVDLDSVTETISPGMVNADVVEAKAAMIECMTVLSAFISKHRLTPSYMLELEDLFFAAYQEVCPDSR